VRRLTYSNPFPSARIPIPCCQHFFPGPSKRAMLEAAPARPSVCSTLFPPFNHTLARPHPLDTAAALHFIFPFVPDRPPPLPLDPNPTPLKQQSFFVSLCRCKMRSHHPLCVPNPSLSAPPPRASKSAPRSLVQSQCRLQIMDSPSSFAKKKVLRCMRTRAAVHGQKNEPPLFC
jgi:hypothetical protein